MNAEWIDTINFDSDGLLPVVTVDHKQGDVLMLATMSRESLALTVETGHVHYFSRSRNSLGKKGEESGHIQILKEIFVDCDPPNRLLLRVTQAGNAACHTGFRSCFYRKIGPEGNFEELGIPVFDPKSVYKKS